MEECTINIKFNFENYISKGLKIINYYLSIQTKVTVILLIFKLDPGSSPPH